MQYKNTLAHKHITVPVRYGSQSGVLRSAAPCTKIWSVTMTLDRSLAASAIVCTDAKRNYPWFHVLCIERGGSRGWNWIKVELHSTWWVMDWSDETMSLTLKVPLHFTLSRRTSTSGIAKYKSCDWNQRTVCPPLTKPIQQELICNACVLTSKPSDRQMW